MVWWVETKKSNSRQDKNFIFSKYSRQDISRNIQTNSRQDKTFNGPTFRDKTRQDSHSCQEIIKTSRQEISRLTPAQIQLIAKKIFIFSQKFFEVHKWTAPKISHLLWHWIQVVTSTYKFFYGSVWLCAENIWDEVLYMVGRGNLNKHISRYF